MYSVEVRIGLQGEHEYEYEMRETLNLAEVRIGSQQCKGHHKAILQLTQVSGRALFGCDAQTSHVLEV